VNWTNQVDGSPLHGILIKPAGFDATKRYPMLHGRQDHSVP
jgi:dipeptidyl aminopeptidase/acylaminoacyl peptidase